jgi:hypothetical protein
MVIPAGVIDHEKDNFCACGQADDWIWIQLIWFARAQVQGNKTMPHGPCAVNKTREKKKVVLKCV